MQKVKYIETYYDPKTFRKRTKIRMMLVDPNKDYQADFAARKAKIANGASKQIR